MMRWIPLLLAGSFVLAQSGGAWAQAKPAGSAPDASKDVPAKIDLSQSKTKEKTESLVLPVPSELVRQMQASSYGSKLSASVNPHLHKYEGMPAWQAALTLGASISDVLLGLETAPDAKILTGLDDVVAGMKYLKLPDDQIAKVSQLRADYASKKIDKNKLTEGFDSLRADMLHFGRDVLGPQNYGLLIAGGWASGAYLTAQAASAYPDALNDLKVLKVNSVIETLLRLVGTGPEAKPVVASLNMILPITTKGRPSAVTPHEAALIETATGKIVSLIPQ